MAEPTSTIVQYLQHLVGVMPGGPAGPTPNSSRDSLTRVTRRHSGTGRTIRPTVRRGTAGVFSGRLLTPKMRFEAAFLDSPARRQKFAKTRQLALPHFQRLLSIAESRCSGDFRTETRAAVNSHSPASPALISTDDDQVIWEELGEPSGTAPDAACPLLSQRQKTQAKPVGYSGIS